MAARDVEDGAKELGRKLKGGAKKMADRLKELSERAKAAITGHPTGYAQLDTDAGLTQSFLQDAGRLPGDEPPPPYQPGQYQPPGGGGGAAAAGHRRGGQGQHASQDLAAMVPSQAEQVVQTTQLAKEAASLLWEAIAFQGSDPDPEVQTHLNGLKENAGLLGKQLRGMLTSYEGAEEALLAEALEALDMLNTCLEEPEPPAAGAGLGCVGPPHTWPDAQAAEGAAAAAAVGPLIDLGEPEPPAPVAVPAPPPVSATNPFREATAAPGLPASSNAQASPVLQPGQSLI